ncbi:MAG: carbonic anhydrase [Opitutales bacterium]
MTDALILASATVLNSASKGSGMRAEEALKRLKEGNARFVAGESEHPRLGAAHRARIAENGQHPFVTIMGCSDSRASIELLFDQGVGDVFVIRVAGNVIGAHEAGSIEYGIGPLQTPLLVVLGHTHCSAVAAAARGAAMDGNIPELLAPIASVVADVRGEHPEAEGAHLLDLAIQANVFNSIQSLLLRSECARRLVKEKKLRIEGAVYDLSTGEVSFLGEHPRQAALLEPPSNI